MVPKACLGCIGYSRGTYGLPRLIKIPLGLPRGHLD
jgi:hypothetical protein